MRDRKTRGLAAPFAAGAEAAFCSTLLSSRLLGRVDAARSYAPLAGYRVALGLAAAVAIAARSGTIRP